MERTVHRSRTIAAGSLAWAAQGLVAALRLVLVPPFHAAALLSDASAEWASRRVRYLPEKLWSVRPKVSVRRLGLRFHLDLRDNVQRILYFSGCYERSYLRFLLTQLRPADVYIDVGAHIGIHAQTIAKALIPSGGGVFAFEPAPEIAAVLRETANENELSNLTVVPTALGRKAGRLPLRSDPIRFHASDAAVRSFYGPGSDVCIVPVQTFDSWAIRNRIERIDLVKIDVEGAELDVIAGMEQSLRKFRPRLIGLEISKYLMDQAGTTESDLRMMLAEFGYHPVLDTSLDGNFVFCLRDSADAFSCREREHGLRS